MSACANRADFRLYPNQFVCHLYYIYLFIFIDFQDRMQLFHCKIPGVLPGLNRLLPQDELFVQECRTVLNPHDVPH
jgi:hypothetical protein